MYSRKSRCAIMLPATEVNPPTHPLSLLFFCLLTAGNLSPIVRQPRNKKKIQNPGQGKERRGEERHTLAQTNILSHLKSQKSPII